MVLWTASTSKAKDKEYKSLFESGYDLHILVTNVEAFSTDKGRLFADKFFRAHRALMAIDESTTIKNPTAKRTKAIFVVHYGGFCTNIDKLIKIKNFNIYLLIYLYSIISLKSSYGILLLIFTLFTIALSNKKNYIPKLLILGKI